MPAASMAIAFQEGLRAPRSMSDKYVTWTPLRSATCRWVSPALPHLSNGLTEQRLLAVVGSVSGHPFRPAQRST